MRKLLTSIAILSLMATPAMAHDHGKDKKDKKDKSHAEQSHPNHAKGEMGDEMKQMADDHAAHGTMSQGKDHMAHDKMDHANMDHGKMDHNMMNNGAGHMKGPRTMPADGAVLQTSPKMVGVDFGHSMTVEAITITTLVGDRIELDVSNIGASSHVMVKAPELQADDYMIEWRARGVDGHLMSGSSSFTVE